MTDHAERPEYARAWFLLAESAVFASLFVRLGVFARELFDGAHVFIPVREPDVFYHFKRVEAAFHGRFDVFFTDPTLNAPCTFAPPWAAGFDVVMAYLVEASTLFAPVATSQERFVRAGAIVMGVSLFTFALLGRALRRWGAASWAALVGVLLASADFSVLVVGHFGKLDNQLADLLSLVVAMVVLGGGLRGRVPWAACALVALVATSDVALLLVASTVGVAVLHAAWDRDGSVAPHRAGLVLLALGTAAVVGGERALDLTRSYSPFVAVVVGTLAFSSAFLGAAGHLPSRRARLAVFVPAAALLGALFIATGGLDLATFLAGDDAVVHTMSEGRSGLAQASALGLVGLSVALVGSLLALGRSGRSPIERRALGTILVLVTALFLAQVKFRYLLAGPVALGASHLARLAGQAFRARAPDLAPALARALPPLGFVAVAAMSLALAVPVVRNWSGGPTPDTRAVHEMASFVRGHTATGPCTMLSHPDLGTAMNLLAGCHVSASTFWGDPCSKAMHLRTLAACQGALPEVLRLRRDHGFRYLLVEANEGELEAIRRTPLQILHGIRYASAKFGEARHLLLFDLRANEAALERMTAPSR